VQIVDATKNSQKTETTINTTSTPPPAKQGVNEVILSTLSKAMQDANLPGEDYLEYIQAVQALKDLPLTDEMKFKTAFSTLSIKGLTLQKIVESADYYTKVLENEKNKFYEELNNRSNSMVKQSRAEIENLKGIANEKAEMIKKLTAEIQATQQKIEGMQKGIEESENKLKTAENDFVSTYQFMIDKIKSNTDKTKQIIQN
jgi:predicted RNase H-like nuclease (RuvC/YqgF family)